MADLGKDSKAGCNEGECEINHHEPAKHRGKIPIVMIKNIKNRRDIFKAMYLCGGMHPSAVKEIAPAISSIASLVSIQPGGKSPLSMSMCQKMGTNWENNLQFMTNLYEMIPRGETTKSLSHLRIIFKLLQSHMHITFPRISMHTLRVSVSNWSARVNSPSSYCTVDTGYAWLKGSGKRKRWGKTNHGEKGIWDLKSEVPGGGGELGWGWGMGEVGWGCWKISEKQSVCREIILRSWWIHPLNIRIHHSTDNYFERYEYEALIMTNIHDNMSMTHIS